MARTNGHIAKFKIAPGRREEAIEMLKPMFSQVAKESGALLYIMHLPESDPDTIWFYERYEDDNAFEIHSSSAAHDKALEDLLTVIDAPWELHWLNLEFGKGLPSSKQD